ncbi:MAG: nucleoside hydrolase [Planctomycetaceae bacterium]|jgi:hypothetical protein|nr:nucleoside hydrolase [Planctomycetaceae bacterium]
MSHLFSRRSFLQTSVLLPFGCNLFNVFGTETVSAVPFSTAPVSTVPVIHLTDLFHPHGDPDDHFDLACIYSLASQGLIDLKGIGIDYLPGFRQGDPDFMAVAQLNRICGLNVPAYVGSEILVAKKDDTLPNLSRRDEIGIRFLIETLQKSDRPVAITIVGSATDVAVAARREPELFRTKCSGIYLNSGGTHQAKPEILEYNVKLNPAAYAAMFELPCPLYWFPCWNMTEERKSGEWGTFYWLSHKKALEGIQPSLATFFWYMFSQSKDPRYLRMLKTTPPETEWNKILEGQRGMWSTASFFILAGLTVTKSGKIVSAHQAGDDALFRMEPVKVQCEDNGRLTWELSKKETNCFIFHVLDVPAYPEAMTQAVHSLLLAIHHE